MGADGVHRSAVREQVAAGRLLALGGPEDGVWITERAAARVLRAAGAAVPDARLERLVIRPVDPGALDWGAVRRDRPAAPPGAAPAGPLLVTADFTAGTGRPLPATARALRTALAAAASGVLGLPLAGVDLRAVGLLTEREAADGPGPGADGGAGASGAGPSGGGPSGGGTARADAAVRAVPGVREAAVRWTPGGVRAYVVTAAGHRALDVALAVRGALAAGAAADARGAGVGAAGAPATAVVVTGAGA